MYISRIEYDGCNSFQDANYQGSSQPDSLFNLTQNYYCIISEDEISVQTDMVSEVGNIRNL